MANINRVTITGNLTRDPELRSTGGGMSVCKLGVAVNHRRKDQSDQWVDEPNYFNVVVFGAQGQNCAQYLSKGRPVAVDGRLLDIAHSRVGIAMRGRPDERRHVQVRTLFYVSLEQEQRDPAIFIVHARRKLVRIPGRPAQRQFAAKVVEHTWRPVELAGQWRVCLVVVVLACAE